MRAGDLVTNPWTRVDMAFIPQVRGKPDCAFPEEDWGAVKTSLLSDGNPRAALWGMMLLAGLRVGEAICVMWGDLVERPELPGLRVCRSWHNDLGVVPTKTGADRLVPIHPRLGELMSNAGPAGTTVARTAASGSRWGRSEVWRWLQRDLSRAGIERRPAHSLRRMWVSMLRAQNVSDSLISLMKNGEGVTSDLDRYTTRAWMQQCEAIKTITV